MTTSYPAALDSFTNPTGTDELDDEIGTRTHSEFHADNNDAIEAIQAELGTTPKGAAANVGARILATETVANAALPTATAATTYQPLDSDLTAIAALSTTAYGRAVLELANQAALSALVDHGGVAGLSDDDHSQYVLVAGTRSSAQVVLQAGNAAHVPLIAKGAASQSAVLQSWQDSAGTMLASVSAAGLGSFPIVSASTYQGASGTGPYLALTSLSLAAINRTTISNPVFIVAGMTGQTGPLLQAQDSVGTILARIADNGSFMGPYVQAVAVTGAYLAIDASGGLSVINRTSAAYVPLTVKGMAAQSANLQQWQNSAGTMLASVSAAGLGTFAGVTLTDATNLVVGSTTGTKIGTATTQKLGFWNATPVVQPTNVTNPTGGATVDAEARTAIDAILSRLETIGLFAA